MQPGFAGLATHGQVVALRVTPHLLRSLPSVGRPQRQRRLRQRLPPHLRVAATAHGSTIQSGVATGVASCAAVAEIFLLPATRWVGVLGPAVLCQGRAIRWRRDCRCDGCVRGRRLPHVFVPGKRKGETCWSCPTPPSVFTWWPSDRLELWGRRRRPQKARPVRGAFERRMKPAVSPSLADRGHPRSKLRVWAQSRDGHRRIATALTRPSRCRGPRSRWHRTQARPSVPGRRGDGEATDSQHVRLHALGDCPMADRPASDHALLHALSVTALEELAESPPNGLSNLDVERLSEHERASPRHGCGAEI